MTKPSELPLNTVIEVEERHGWRYDYIRTEHGWSETASPDQETYDADYGDEHFQNYTVLSGPIDVAALMKDTALNTLDAMLEAYKPKYVITRESLQKYRDEIEDTDFTEDAVRWTTKK